MTFPSTGIEQAVLELGDPLPQFQGLLAADGKRYSFSSFDLGGQLVIVFVGNGCPSVKAYGAELNRIDQFYGPKGAQLVVVNSNNPALSPPDTWAEMVKVSEASSWAFPYLKDADGALARDCGALTTPHAFVFDAGRRLRYRGRLTDSRDPSRATTSDLADAIEDLQAEHEIRVPETEPIGCSIVW